MDKPERVCAELDKLIDSPVADTCAAPDRTPQVPRGGIASILYHVHALSAYAWGRRQRAHKYPKGRITTTRQQFCQFLSPFQGASLATSTISIPTSPKQGLKMTITLASPAPVLNEP